MNWLIKLYKLFYVKNIVKALKITRPETPGHCYTYAI
jgi:hypothetical protein